MIYISILYYSADVSVGGVPTGEKRILAVMQMPKTYTGLSGEYTVETFKEKVPEFSENATIWVIDDDVQIQAMNAGLTNVMDIRQHVGETWTFANEYYITVTKTIVSESRTDYIVNFYDPNNNLIFSQQINTQNPDYGYFLVSDVSIGTAFHCAEFYFGTILPNRFQTMNNQWPLMSPSTTTNFWNGAGGTSDPYGADGFSSTGGGSGTFSGTGDNIGIPSLPTLSATSAGFITLFNPTAAQMAALAGYMWTGAFDLDTFRKIFADPMDCILGLSIVPVDVPTGGATTVKVGNISTGVTMNIASSQYVAVDCGTLNVKEYWGAYLDYDPYTKAEIYLPYIGTHPLAVDDIMDKAVHVVYHVDILSGACVAYIQCGGTVLYSFIGQCSSSIPISGNDWTNVVNGVLSIAGSIGSMVATGGASAPAAVGNIVSTAVNSLKPTVEKSGSLSGTGGMMGVQTPYLILTRPRQALPEQQNVFMGYPSFITENLADLSGYTEIEQIHLENIPATSGEIAELESILKGGVIF